MSEVEFPTRTVWKYELPWIDAPVVTLPESAGLLSVGLQEDKLVLWALVDPDRVEPRRWQFRIAGTGHPIVRSDLNGAHFVGTVQLANGLVFHVWGKQAT